MLSNLPRVASVCVSMFVMISCGKADFGHKDKRNGASDQEQLAAESDQEGCLSLGGPGQNPGQPGYDNGGNDVVIVVPPNSGKGDEPPPPPPGKGGPGYNDPGYNRPGKRPCTAQNPGQNPGQPPCKVNCGKDGGYRPIDADDDVVVVQPFPTQRPIDPTSCGKHGKYCDDGGPGQWPTQTISGGAYDRHHAESCLSAFRRAGFDTRGQWNIDVRQVRNVNVLSQDTITDFGVDHSLVIIKNVSVLGRMHFELLNPNALYCIENVSVLEQVLVSSCHTGNVVWGKDVNVLSSVQTQPVACR